MTAGAVCQVGGVVIVAAVDGGIPVVFEGEPPQEENSRFTKRQVNISDRRIDNCKCVSIRCYCGLLFTVGETVAGFLFLQLRKLYLWTMGNEYKQTHVAGLCIFLILAGREPETRSRSDHGKTDLLAARYCKSPRESMAGMSPSWIPDATVAAMRRAD